MVQFSVLLLLQKQKKVSQIKPNESDFVYSEYLQYLRLYICVAIWSENYTIISVGGNEEGQH